jgi:putative oxidoreductase
MSMTRFLSRFEEPSYALFRFVFGLAFIFHGTQKLFGWPGDGRPAELLSLRGVAGGIEVFGGAMIALGLAAAWAAFIATGLMAVAYFMRHAPQGFWPIVNKGELAVLYCFAFLYVASRGSGRYSVDHALRRRQNSVL